MTRSNAGSESC